MSAILLTAGPINTHEAFMKCGPDWLRHVTKTPYLTAARRLESLDLVHLVRRGVNLNVVVVKKTPDEVEGILEANCICSSVEYRRMFEEPLPDAISDSIKHQMVVDGYLHEKHLN